MYSTFELLFCQYIHISKLKLMFIIHQNVKFFSKEKRSNSKDYASIVSSFSVVNICMWTHRCSSVSTISCVAILSWLSPSVRTMPMWGTCSLARGRKFCTMHVVDTWMEMVDYVIKHCTLPEGNNEEICGRHQAMNGLKYETITFLFLWEIVFSFPIQYKCWQY